MSEETEEIKKIVAFRQRLEKRVEELESELKEVQAILEIVNSLLLQKSFRRMEISKAPTEVEGALPSEGVTAAPTPFQSKVEFESLTPLRTVTGELLANLYATEDSLRVVPAEDKHFDVKTPPFTHFLVERVLAKMQEKDNELVRTGQLQPEKSFCYNIIRKNDEICEIIIKNVGQDRLRELKSSIRWTFEKMYEKMKSQA
ncbi:MAG: hypothetical protein QXZ25_02955 [Candidatus Bathyarchaeia archaeon]